VLSALQTLWARANVSVKHSPGGDTLSVTGDFGLPPAVGEIAPSSTGAHLMLESGAAMALDASLPAGSWSRRGKVWTYRDPAGSLGGIRSVVLRIRTVGGAPDVQMTVKGKGTYPITVASPLTALVLFGDDGAKLDGSCARYTFGGGACASHGKSRLVCH